MDYLAGNTVLIVRHTEKPESGRGLSVLGEEKADAFVRVFAPFFRTPFFGTPFGTEVEVQVSSLFAGADSDHSMRPRLTLEPLGRATGLRVDASMETRAPEALVARLRAEPHGDVPLICWRHKQMAALLRAFGATPEALLPGGEWPEGMYDRVVVLRLDAESRLGSAAIAWLPQPASDGADAGPV